MSKVKNADATVVPVAAVPTVPATVNPPASKTVHRVMSELDAGLKDGSIEGPFADADGKLESKKGFQGLFAAFPGDAGAFTRDASGKLVYYRLKNESGKLAVVRTSAGPSKAGMLVRTSDVHQRRFLDHEKPKGAAKGKADVPAAGVVLPQ